MSCLPVPAIRFTQKLFTTSTAGLTSERSVPPPLPSLGILYRTVRCNNAAIFLPLTDCAWFKVFEKSVTLKITMNLSWHETSRIPTAECSLAKDPLSAFLFFWSEDVLLDLKIIWVDLTAKFIFLSQWPTAKKKDQWKCLPCLVCYFLCSL